MGILSINVGVTGLVGETVNPRRNTMVTTDSLSTITTAGYLNGQNSSGNPILPTDIFEVLYSYNTATKSGTFGIFTVTFSSSTGFQLVIWDNPGNVLLPVTSGDFAVFNGTTGQIKDAGYLPTNAALTRVVMQSGAATSGDIPKYNDTTGTLIDSGITAASLTAAVANNALLNTVSVTLNSAAVLAAYATPQLLIASPGTGKVIVPVACMTYTNVGTSAFASGGVGVVQWGNTVHGGGTLAIDADTPSAEITAATSQVYVQYGIVTTSVLTGVSATGIYFSNKTQAFTTGVGSSLTFTIQYMILTATV